MWGKVEEMSCFPTKCPILHTGGYYHFLNDNGALWIWGALRSAGRSVLTFMPCYVTHWRGREGREQIVWKWRTVSVLAEWRERKKKVPLEHSWNVWYFHQNIGFMACMEGFCGHYLTWITLGLNTSFSSAKHLVQGQCLALESHIAVWKTLLLRLRARNTVLSWHIV